MAGDSFACYTTAQALTSDFLTILVFHFPGFLIMSYLQSAVRSPLPCKERFLESTCRSWRGDGSDLVRRKYSENTAQDEGQPGSLGNSPFYARVSCWILLLLFLQAGDLALPSHVKPHHCTTQPILCFLYSLPVMPVISLSGSFLFAHAARHECDRDLCGRADPGVADSGWSAPSGQHQLQRSRQLRRSGE